MYFIALADLHLSDSPSESFGVDTRTNFKKALNKAVAHRPDYLVMMGDYSLRQPLKKDVQHAYHLIKKAGLKSFAIAGNHDVANDVKEVFHPENTTTYFSKEFEQVKAIFLDVYDGSIGSLQFEWLKKQLQTTKKVMLFMHYPPVSMGVPFMDKNYRFKDNGDRFKSLLHSHLHPISIFCGHYHTTRSTQVGMHTINLCPSTFYQLDPTQANFQVVHSMPGIRHIKIEGDAIHTWAEFIT